METQIIETLTTLLTSHRILAENHEKADHHNKHLEELLTQIIKNQIQMQIDLTGLNAQISALQTAVAALISLEAANGTTQQPAIDAITTALQALVTAIDAVPGVVPVVIPVPVPVPVPVA